MNWFIKNWPIPGLVFGFLIMATLWFLRVNISSLTFLLWTHLVLLFLHQFEEYIFPGGFKDFFNKNVLNRNGSGKMVLGDKAIFVVNVILGWFAYLTSALLGSSAMWLMAGLLMVTVINGSLHGVMGLLLRKPNPGMITGVLLFIPFGLYALIQISPLLSGVGWMAGILTCLVGSGAIPLTIYLAKGR